jgi:SOS response regulatory protein OraA/RecX
MKCLPYALRLLGRRGYFEAELALRLKEKYTEEEADAALSELKRLDFIDDGRLLENFIRWQTEKGHGELYIRRALIAKGVNYPLGEIRRLALSAEKAGCAIRKYAEKYCLRHPDKAWNGCYAYLASRGFLKEDILTVLNDIKKENRK